MIDEHDEDDDELGVDWLAGWEAGWRSALEAIVDAARMLADEDRVVRSSFDRSRACDRAPTLRATSRQRWGLSN